MIISLDCSTTAIGWSVWDKDDLLYYGRLIPSSSKLLWRDRTKDLSQQLKILLDKYKPTKIYQEDVPLGGQGGALTLARLYYAQGAYAMVEDGIEIEYVGVGAWRKRLHINDGDQHREQKKIKSINKANELFNLNLPIEYTKGGNYKENGSDDIADSINIYASTRNKYTVPQGFGKVVKFSSKKG